MSVICVTCGLPDELCVCQDIAKESQRITIYVDKRRFRKEYTIIEGLDESEIDVKNLTKKLKHKLACGGTAKEGRIEMQGSHLEATANFLMDQGFAPETIDVKK